MTTVHVKATQDCDIKIISELMNILAKYGCELPLTWLTPKSWLHVSSSVAKRSYTNSTKASSLPEQSKNNAFIYFSNSSIPKQCYGYGLLGREVKIEKYLGIASIIIMARKGEK